MEQNQSKIVYNGFTTVTEVDVSIGDKVIKRELVSRGTGECVAGLLVDRDKKTLYLVKQYRIGSNSYILEAVAGMVDEGETPEEAFKREALEEVGFKIEELIPTMCPLYSSPGMTNERIHFFIGYGSVVSDGGGIDDEDISIIAIPLTQFQYIADKIYDLKTQLICVSYYYEMMYR